MAVRFGIDRLLDGDAAPAAQSVRSARRVGLVTNDAARLARDPVQRTRRALQDAGISLVRLFGPEHGLGASAADGAAVQDDADPLTELPVCSLYGERMRPAREQVVDLDLLLFDIPDIGARFYTYTWTLYHVMAACAEFGVPLVVLDRPNPLGGVLAAVEGPMLDPSCRSFVGEDAIPIRHALTLGELARLWQRERYPTIDLQIVPCEGWQREQVWTDTGLPWVPTSPAMPAFASAIWYPGTCLFEATSCSVGRGTPWPFEVIGAPWMDADRVCRRMTGLALPGLRLEPVRFTPTTAPWAGISCEGVRLMVVEGEGAQVHASSIAWQIASRIRPVRTGLQLLQAIMQEHGDRFAWAPYVTAANPTGAGHFARLSGDPRLADRLIHLRGDELMAATTTPEWATRVQGMQLYR